MGIPLITYKCGEMIMVSIFVHLNLKNLKMEIKWQDNKI